MKKIIVLVVLALTALGVASAQEQPVTYDYLELGLTTGTPGGLNPMVGYSLDDLTIRASGMSLGKTFGFLAELDYNLGKSNYYKNGPGLVVGYMDYSDDTGNFHVVTNGVGVRGLVVGAHYFWNWGLFYSSLGLGYTAINPNSNPPITLLFNIGINYRFLKSE